MLTTTFVSALALALAGSAAPLAARTNCPTYVLINTRGTFEPQGESLGFDTMNSEVEGAISGGSIYNVVYPAGIDQNSSAATTDIINQVNNGLASNPDQCFILEGYSQGAAATVNALSQLTGAAFDSVKAVVLLGNPFHKAGLACNVDQTGGNTTYNDNGISEYQGVYIPDAWVSKTRDVCWFGDVVCDVTESGLNAAHLMYPGSAAVQSAGAAYIQAALS